MQSNFNSNNTLFKFNYCKKILILNLTIIDSSFDNFSQIFNANNFDEF